MTAPQVPERAGPGPNDPSSLIWPYTSSSDPTLDTNTGLVGAIIISAAHSKRADDLTDPRPADVDREIIWYFSLINEMEAHHLDINSLG